MNQLTIGGIISNAIQIGLKNMASIVVAVFLWIITIWIPYLNVGTTIAMIGMVVAISKGGIISPLEIFDAKYRRNMGEFFLLIGFLEIGIIAGYLFAIIPGIVISIAWGQAIFLLIDKNMNPTEAITVSNKLTYGKKWTIFLAYFILGVVLVVAIYILVTIFGFVWGFLGKLVGFIGYIAMMCIFLSAAAYIYGELSKELDTAEPATA
ncbi:MAG: hypothetical protein Kow0042_29780 [Calditrichia bacterium]